MPNPRSVYRRGDQTRSGKMRPVDSTSPQTTADLYKQQADAGYGLAVCPVCGREVAKRKDGQLRSHQAGVRPNRWPCPGATANKH